MGPAVGSLSMAERGQSHQEGSVVCVGDNFFYRMTEGNI